MKVSLGKGGSVIVVTVRGKREEHSPAGLPDLHSLAVEDEMRAFHHELPVPSIAYLLKNAEQLLFLAFSARQGSADEKNTYNLLNAFSRYRGENTHILGAIGAASQQLAGHLRTSFACLAGCEESGAFHALHLCQQAAADMRMFSNEGWDRFQAMAEVSSSLLETLTGQKWPWGLEGNLGFRPASERPRGFEALNAFLVAQDTIWKHRNAAKERVTEAKDECFHDFHVTKEMEKAERGRNGLAAIPLMFRAFSSTAAPAATALQGEGRDALAVRQTLERLVSFSDCRIQLLQSAAGHVGLITRAALAGNFREAAIQALAAAIPIFQEIANVMQDFHEFCDELDNGYYLSFLSHFRLEALLRQAQQHAGEKRRKLYGRPSVARAAFMSMTRMQAVSRLCAAYCAEHERELSHENSLRAFSAMSEEERLPSNLAAVLAASLKDETVADAMMSQLRLLERKERILKTLIPAP